MSAHFDLNDLMAFRAVAELGNFRKADGLDRVQAAIRPGQPLDGGDGAPLQPACGVQAGALRHAVDEHGAGSTLAHAAAKAGAREAQGLAQQPKQGFVLPAGWYGLGLLVQGDVHAGLRGWYGASVQRRGRLVLKICAKQIRAVTLASGRGFE